MSHFGRGKEDNSHLLCLLKEWKSHVFFHHVTATSHLELLRRTGSRKRDGCKERLCYLPHLLCCSPWGRCPRWVVLFHNTACDDFYSTAVPSPAFDELSGGGTAPLTSPCETSLHWAITHGAGGASGGAGVHQNLEQPFQSCSLRRCLCTWDKPCLESQIFLCFCFDCIKEKSLWPVRCSMPTTLQVKERRCCLGSALTSSGDQAVSVPYCCLWL